MRSTKVSCYDDVKVARLVCVPLSCHGLGVLGDAGLRLGTLCLFSHSRRNDRSFRTNSAISSLDRMDMTMRETGVERGHAEYAAPHSVVIAKPDHYFYRSL